MLFTHDAYAYYNTVVMNQNLSQTERKALEFISNLTKEGTPPSVRRIMEHLGYKSTRSVSLIIQSLIEKNLLAKRPDGKLRLIEDVQDNDSLTVNIPLVGSVPCGTPLLAVENIETTIPVSRSLVKNPSDYFILRASGDSMDEAGIQNGDLLLIKQQPTACEGDRVVALIDDEATVKSIHFGDNAAVLLPRSTNKTHKPIIVSDDFIVQGIVKAVIPSNV